MQTINSQTTAKIIDVTAEVYGISTDEIKGRRRTKNIAEARQMAMYILLQNPRASLVQVGKLFNRRHSTVNYVYEQMSIKIESNSDVAERYKTIKNKL